MNHQSQCIPCFLRRVLQIAGLVTSDEWLHRKILAEVMQDLARFDDKSTPAEVMHDVFRRTAKALGTADPFTAEKARWKEEVLANAETIRARVSSSDDAFLQALTLSLVANAVDDELLQGLTLKTILERPVDQPVESDNLDEFQASVGAAKSILFVHDTVGELFFDRLLIEELLRAGGADPEAGPGRVTSVVRHQPILGDATREDAVDFGLDQVAHIVDTGVDGLGLPLTECSEEFREVFRAADVVIAKGQANYQTLEAEGRTPGGGEKEVWFLFRVKCPVMARKLAASIGELLIESN
jgi:uncharacterized protein with ATP-grasp and redox domains